MAMKLVRTIFISRVKTQNQSYNVLIELPVHGWLNMVNGDLMLWKTPVGRFYWLTDVVSKCDRLYMVLELELLEQQQMDPQHMR